MFDLDQSPLLAARVRMLQVVVAAMAMGVIAFLVIVFVLPAQIGGEAETDKLPTITYVALAYGAVALPVGPLVSTVIVAMGRRRHARSAPQAPSTAPAGNTSDAEFLRSDDGVLLRLFATKTVIGLAVYEGAAIFLCVAYLLEHNPLSALIAAVLAVGILVQMPSRDRTQRWMDSQLRQLDEDR